MHARTLSRIKSRLLADPALINVREAAVRLVSKRDRCTPKEARERLSEGSTVNEITDVLRIVLPESERVWRPRFRNIYDLTRVLGFPVYEDYLGDMIEEWREEGVTLAEMSIPICGLNPTYGFQDYQSLPLVYRLAALLDRVPHADEYRDTGIDGSLWAQIERECRLSPAERPTGSVSREALDRVLSRQRSPIRHLPSALDVIHYDTGYAFLDFNEEWGDADIPWTREFVIRLRRDAKESMRLLKRMNKLDEWLRRDTTERVAHALRLYRKAQQTDVKKQAVRVHARAGGRALADVL